jgi:hypothetical protein
MELGDSNRRSPVVRERPNRIRNAPGSLCEGVRLIHMQAPAWTDAGRTDPRAPFPEDEHMKKRLLITGIVFAALLLALYGVVFGTGGD